MTLNRLFVIGLAVISLLAWGCTSSGTGQDTRGATSTQTRSGGFNDRVSGSQSSSGVEIDGSTLGLQAIYFDYDQSVIRADQKSTLEASAALISSNNWKLITIQGHTEERMNAMRNYLGLDQPMYIRYIKWIWRLFQGDLGRSFLGTISYSAVDKPVKNLIGDRLWLTVVLTGFTIMVTWTFAIPVGIYSGVRQHSVGDYTFTLLGFTGLAVPDFLLGLVLMYVGYSMFDQSVGGLFSADYIDKPLSVGKFLDLSLIHI